MNNKKRVLMSFLLFAMVMVMLGIPYVWWGFINDDYGFIWYAQINKLSELFKFFGQHDIGDAFNPTNYSHKISTFTNAFYRPMQFVLFGLETYVLGVSPYKLLLLVTALHAGVTVVLFNLFLNFFAMHLALFGALFFAVHPTLFHWMGVFTCHIYIVDLIYLLLAAWFLKNYFEHKHVGYYVLSCLVALISIFAKETLIVMPVWVGMVGVMWCYHRAGETWSCNHLWYGFKLSLGYGAAALMYVGCRAWLFPFVSEIAQPAGFSTIMTSFLLRQRERLGDFISYACDYLYVGLIPPGNQCLKGLLVFLLIGLIAWPFITTKKKMYGLFLLSSMLLFTWPAILLYYQPRYLYIGLPFFMLMVLYAVQYYAARLFFVRSFIMPVSCLLFLLNAGGFMVKQQKKEEVLHTILSAFTSLVQNPDIQQRPVCFVGLPMHWFGSGNAQALWLLQNTKERQPVFYDLHTFLFKREPFYDIVPHRLEVEKIEHGVRMRSQDPENLTFGASLSELSSLGYITVHDKNRDGLSVEMSLEVDERWRAYDPVFVSWDFEQQQFKVL